MVQSAQSSRDILKYLSFSSLILDIFSNVRHYILVYISNTLAFFRIFFFGESNAAASDTVEQNGLLHRVEIC